VEVAKMDFNSLMQNQKRFSAGSKLKNDKKIVEYDFKVVSFKIGNEYYGIDILKVKEILKEKRFTIIPNAMNFVVGVTNLRGDIVPIIDLGRMFNLKDKLNEDALKSIIILYVGNLNIGIVVDQIQHVIPLRKRDIQPPSPLLGMINEKYISGVAELNDKLVVILDSDAIFSDKEKQKKDTIQHQEDVVTDDFIDHFCTQVEQHAGVYINKYNKAGFRSLYSKYAGEVTKSGLPVVEKELSGKIIGDFLSKHTEELWDIPYTKDFMNAVMSKLGKICSEEVRILDVGCAQGHEAFSVFFLMADEFSDADISMVASDNNLVAISKASGFEISKKNIPSWIHKEKYFMEVKGDSLKVKKEFNDMICFEFHNAENLSTYKKVFDLIIARDLSLFITEAGYTDFINEAAKRLVQGGVLIIGDHEDLPDNEHFRKVQDENIAIYFKK